MLLETTVTAHAGTGEPWGDAKTKQVSHSPSSGGVRGGR